MRTRIVLLLFLAVALTALSGLSGAAKPPASPPVLILYDTNGPYGWMGQIHARMLANLLGHFPVRYRAMPVQSYRRGDVDRSAATFYLGSTYDNPLPAAFVQDVMNSTKPVCWFKYNIWQLAWSDNRFPVKFGFTFNWLDWNGYNHIRYQGHVFTKYQEDPELGLVWILYPSICEEVATACRTVGDGEDQEEEYIPYIVHGGNLWYVADLPFSYISEEDRYIIFCDVLHDILGIDHPESKRAIVRIEDVDVTTDPDRLRQIADYLYSQGVPFAVSVIPAYADPLGFYNGGVADYDQLSWHPELVSALKYMVARGGSIVLHGYTHQYSTEANPYTGATGDDFEFYRVIQGEGGPCDTLYSGPVPEDSRGWARRRVDAARAELRACGLQEVAWETPHYAASATDYRVFAARFPATIQRALYFDVRSKAGGFRGKCDPTYFGGQFFPYVIQTDIYGQKVIPENLGNVEPEPWECYDARLPRDILRAADKNLAVRDGWASFYFHPFYDLEYLYQLVEGIEARGYTFVSLSADLR